MEFKDFPLKKDVLAALEAKGFKTPTPIQAAALPLALEGRDVLGQARTGTGKTLAFALPIANRLAKESVRGRAPRAVVLTPTQELALQVTSELAWVAPHLEVVAIYGGTGYTKQAEALERGVDAVVATPGRALDYLRQGVLDLSRVEIAVLDEADEMLSMGFEEDVETLLSATPKARQTLFFSATLPPWARRVAERHLKNPVLVNVLKDEGVTYEELALQAPLQSRLSLLSDLLYTWAPRRGIVFTRTKAETEEIAHELGRLAHRASAIHGDMSQREREKAMQAFRQGEVQLLVATDVAARGLDIPEVDLVVHYRLPEKVESYQHRSGRTGRAGRAGRVLLLYGPREKRELETLEKAVGRRFKRINPPTPEEVLEAKWGHLLTRLSRVPKEDQRIWRDFANRLFAEGQVGAVAALLALVLGGAPRPKSLLTGEENWITLRLQGPRLSVGRVVALLKGEGVEEVGRVQLTEGAAYVDLRPEEGERLLAAGLDGLKVERAREAPHASPEPLKTTRPDPSRRRRAQSA
ncbi:MAG: DEAD/DEAH box helicase [Thermaceae bacterium]